MALEDWSKKSADDVRRQQMNEALMKEARDNVLWLMMQAPNNYSQKLQEAQKQLNGNLAKDGNKDTTSAAIMDPAAFDAAIAIGFTPGQAAALSMGAMPSAAGAPLEAYYKALGEAMKMPVTSQVGQSTTGTYPEAMPVPEGAACWIVPNDNRTDFIDIKKLSADDEATFVNLHEAWHCRDVSNKLNDIPQATLDQIEKINVISDLPDDPAARKAFARYNRRESLADVGALGEMIRNGHDPSIIDSVRQWRKETAWDTQHHTLPSIDAFQKKVEEMGVDKFRKLSDEDARKLYVQVMEENALTEKSVEIIYRDKHNMLRNFLDNNVQWIDSDIRKARNFEISRENTQAGFGLVHKTLAAIGHALSGGAAKDAKVADTVVNWDALGEMEDTAFKKSGKITPATMITAYRDMQDKLCEDIRKHPENRQLDEEKMTKLHDYFTGTLSVIDYAAENLRRGLKIEEIEPSLKSFRAKPAPKVAVAAPAVK